MASIPVFLMMLILILLSLAIPVIIGIYVYKDAKSRGMDAVLWTIVAIIAPSFIGLIIYLAMRKEHIVMSCPSCGSAVQEQFSVCPVCGQKLRASCTNCGTPLEPEWKICPQCGSEIKETAEFTPPVLSKGKTGKGLTALIIAIVIIPILLSFFAIISFCAYSVVFSDSDSYISNEEIIDNLSLTPLTVMSVEDFKNETVLDDDTSTAAADWVSKKKASGDKGIYNISYDVEVASSINLQGDDGDDVNVNYSLTYKYIIIVANPPEGKAYNFANSNYVTSDEYDIIGTAPSVALNEVDESQGDKFGNVFVVKYLTGYCINTDNSSTANEIDDQTLTINTTIDGKSFDSEVHMDQVEEYNALPKAAE